MMKRVSTVLAGAAALLVSLTPSAHATAELVLSDVRVSAAVRSVDLTVAARGLAPGTGLDPASVVATVDGRTLPAESVVAATETQHVENPRVLLVVDTSGSMAGQPMIEAKEAITTFVSSAPADVELGLMRFSTAPTMLVPPTRNRTSVLSAVVGLEAQGETSLYDAVRAGVTALGGEGARRVVVLSDGGDTRSTASLQQALQATALSGVAVDAIGFNTDESVQDVLTQIATSGRGRVHSAASSAELSAALAASVRTHASSLDVRLLVPDDVRGSRTLSVTAGTEAGPLTASSPVQLGLDVVESSVPIGWWSSRNALLTGLAAIAGSLLLGSLLLLDRGERGRRRTQDVLQRFTTVPTTTKEDVRRASPVARTALELADRVAAKRDPDETSLRLARAAMSLTPAEWVLLRAAVSLGAVLLLVLLGMHLFLAVPAGTLAGVLLPSTYLRVRGGRRQKAFEDKLPDALQMTASSLTAGYSLAQSLDGLVQEGSEPMATEIGKALAESRLGVPVETTLQGVADRMDSKDFAWVVMAIRVQREVGGNLGGVLTTVSATMRERAMLRRHVRGLSAEGRLSAYILIGLPILLALYMFFVRRDYLEPLYTTGIGWIMIVAAVLLLSFGSFVMSRLVKVEV